MINVDLWSIFPWQLSVSDVYCQATTNITISYASNGEYYEGNTTGEFGINRAIHYEGTNVYIKVIFYLK